MTHLTRSAVAALVATVAAAALVVGDAPAATHLLCTANVQQASPQSLSTSTECNFAVNAYEFALTDHDVTLQSVPPGWQVSYQHVGNQALAFVQDVSAPPTASFSPFDVTAFFVPPETQFPLQDIQIFASPDFGITDVPVAINTFVVRGDFKKSHVGKKTVYGADGKFGKELDAANGIELIYTPDDTVSQCDEIATIQVVTIVDDKGNIKSDADLGTDAPPNGAAKDAAATNGHTVDVGDSEKTPYYQENPNSGAMNNGTMGSSDGAGNGTPSDVSDWPSKLKGHPGWRLLFEAWAVCIKGDNAGEVLAGITWELDGTGTAKIDNDSPAAPSQDFKDAVKSWEGKNPGFTEPGGGFKW